MVHLPYINVLLGKLEQEGDAELKALARHLHFGFWSAPQEAAVTQEDLAVTQEDLAVNDPRRRLRLGRHDRSD